MLDKGTSLGYGAELKDGFRIEGTLAHNGEGIPEEQISIRNVNLFDSYNVFTNENGNFLKSEANNAASGLGKEIIIDLNKTPFINITWKIEQDLNGIKENSKKQIRQRKSYLDF